MATPIDLVQRYYDAFNRRDLAAYDRIFAHDCLVEGPGTERHGIDGSRAFDQVWMTALPDGQIVSVHKAASGNVVLCENRIRGRHTGPLVLPDGTLTASGRMFDDRAVAVFEIENERIRRHTLHFDRTHLVRVLGAPDATARNLDVVRGAYAAFGRRDIPWILEQLDEEVTWGIESVAAHDVPAYGIQHGRQGVSRFFAALLETTELHAFEPGDFVAVGEQVFCTLRYTLTVKATGKRVTCTGSAQQWTFRGGRIWRWRGWEDTAAMREAFTAARTRS